MENRRIVSNDGRWDHNIPEADIKLHSYASSAQLSSESDPHPLIVSPLSDALSLDAGCVENDAIWFDIFKAYVSYCCDDDVDVIVDAAEEIDVLRRTSGWCFPHSEHQSPFKDEMFTVGRLGQPIKESFHGKVLEKLIKGTTAFPRLIE